MIRSLFISKDLDSVPELAQFCEEHSIKLIAQSLIQFKAIDFDSLCNEACIFFSSPRSASFFLSKITLKPEQTIATAGQTTAKTVESFGYSVDFIPTNSGLVTASSKEFSDWLGTKTVLFPISTISNKSYASAIKSNQVRCVEVYETELVPQQIQECDVYVFTSPSNVDTFFKKNEIPKDAKVISWGESTSNYLLSTFETQSIILSNSYVETLIKELVE